MSTERIAKCYLEAIEQIIEYCHSDNIDHVASVKRHIGNLLDEIEVGEDELIARTRDMNVLYPREYSLLYRLVSAFNIHMFMLSKVKAKKNIKAELVAELAIAWDICSELEELFHATTN